jgi:hypothetical protein
MNITKKKWEIQQIQPHNDNPYKQLRFLILTFYILNVLTLVFQREIAIKSTVSSPKNGKMTS